MGTDDIMENGRRDCCSSNESKATNRGKKVEREVTSNRLVDNLQDGQGEGTGLAATRLCGDLSVASKTRNISFKQG